MHVFNGQSDTKTTIGIEQYSPTKPHTNCFEILFVVAQKIQKLKSREFQRIDRRLWYGGGFSIKGLVGYVSFKTIMDGPYFVRILEDHLVRNARKQFERRWRLQLDNDPKHTSRVAKQFLNKEVPEVLDWPSNSPDVNPIENLWSIIKRRVEKRKPTNLEELDKFLREEWKKLIRLF
jgi:hypothetical protein